METLAPSILEIRNSFLERFKNEPLDSISKKLTELFEAEKDPVKKLVLLASRVETIRKRIDQIHVNENKTKIIQESSIESSIESSKEEVKSETQEEQPTEEKVTSETQEEPPSEDEKK